MKEHQEESTLLLEEKMVEPDLLLMISGWEFTQQKLGPGKAEAY